MTALPSYNYTFRYCSPSYNGRILFAEGLEEPEDPPFDWALGHLPSLSNPSLEEGGCFTTTAGDLMVIGMSCTSVALQPLRSAEVTKCPVCRWLTNVWYL
uniref:Uncharacterized protein n=1 Tax=Cacopsylla melanoneura TaxID=428564 RepID=A0A8D8UJZ0_9HEMI